MQLRDIRNEHQNTALVDQLVRTKRRLRTIQRLGFKNGAISQAHTDGNDFVALPRDDVFVEWSLPSSLTTQANTRAAQILESLIYRNLNSSLILSSMDSADFQQAISWDHTRGW
jgi:hypothetical protein